MEKLHLYAVVLAAALLLACDDDEGGGATDSGSDTSDGGDGGSDAAPDAAPDGTAGDTIEEADDVTEEPVDPCSVGASTSGSLGAEGLTLELCTVTLTLPGTALEEGTEVVLSIIDPPLEAPFERAFISPIYAVAADGELAETGTVRLVDTSEEGGYRYLAWYTTEGGEGWVSFETCPEEDGLSSPLFFLGTFALIRDINVYESGPEGLGGGTLTSELGEDEAVEWTFDDGYVIHQDGEDGSRSLTIISRRAVGESGLQQLRIDLTESPEDEISVLQISFLDTTNPDGGWSYLEPVHGPLTGDNTLAVREDGSVAGSVTATVYQGELTEEMVLTLDVTSEKFSFPPEGSCFPEG